MKRRDRQHSGGQGPLESRQMNKSEVTAQNASEPSRITVSTEEKLEAGRSEEGEPLKDPWAVALGRRGGIKGGPARARALTPERRCEIARQAAAARWSDKA